MTVAAANLAPGHAIPESETGPVAYVIDDDSAVTTLVTRMLRVLGYVGLGFTEPNLGLKQLKAANVYVTPKLIVLDLSLGKSDGIAVLNQLKDLQFQGKVLLVSGRDQSALSEIQAMGVSRGLLMLPALRKPFRLDDLKASLAIEPEPIKQAPSATPTESPTAALQRAIASGSLALRYQSRFDLKTRSTTGADVTLYERRSADEFLPLTNAALPADSALNHPLSRAVLRGAMKDWVQHLSDLRKPPQLLVKLPLSVVTTSGFLALVRETLAPFPKFPGLVIEVSDWKQFNNDGAVREAAAQLKLYGIGLAVDDIGAAYAAMTQSTKFPFVELKLNSSFVLNCGINEAKQALCGDAINLAHNVGASVCAEGVVDREELQTLVAMNCDFAQGYLFGKPLPAQAFRAKLLELEKPQTVHANPRAGADSDSLEWPAAAR